MRSRFQHITLPELYNEFKLCKLNNREYHTVNESHTFTPSGFYRYLKAHTNLTSIDEFIKLSVSQVDELEQLRKKCYEKKPPIRKRKSTASFSDIPVRPIKSVKRSNPQSISENLECHASIDFDAASQVNVHANDAILHNVNSNKIVDNFMKTFIVEDNVLINHPIPNNYNSINVIEGTPAFAPDMKEVDNFFLGFTKLDNSEIVNSEKSDKQDSPLGHFNLFATSDEHRNDEIDLDSYLNYPSP